LRFVLKRGGASLDVGSESLAPPVALITPSYSADFERFSLLCDSIDRRVTGYERHYVIVSDDDMPRFQEFSRDRRIVLPSSRLLPRWLKLAPFVRLRNGRKIWWSLKAWPVHGWHVQQILKIAAAMEMPEQRFCLVDSDNVFVHPFDAGAYAGRERSPLYFAPEAIASDAPLHANWTRNCDRLLGQRTTSFPADDYIGHVIVWDKDAVRDMAKAIERTTGKSWQLALCRTRAFSEYLLYGHYVRSSPDWRAAHEMTTQSLAISYWDAAPLGAATVAEMIASAPKSNVALSVQSFSHTSEAMIREAVGLSFRGPEGGSSERLHAA
jgi:hypothetical protein